MDEDLFLSHSSKRPSHLDPSLDYFVCTLGEAADYNSAFPHDFRTINQFLDRQATIYAGEPAVGFPVPDGEDKDWHYELFSFQDLRQGSIAILNELVSVLPIQSRDKTTCVALLCSSSIDFLFSWLALIRGGYSVLLIAPQCQPAAIVHLCQSCNASVLLHDYQHAPLAKAAASDTNYELVDYLITWHLSKTSITSMIRSSSVSCQVYDARLATEHDIAYVHHTSGTSSGLPKPIPQTHHAAVGVLPCLNGNGFASFTTTPLYHGGIADCFRAWTSRTLIWLFPGAYVPITPKNIISSLSATREAHLKRPSTPAVRCFSSVPYVIQMLADDSAGKNLLLEMDLVGVGGAALAQSLGDMLVSKGVNLVSRFGSAECGFLLSSHRAYESDKEWQYLRVPSGNRFLTFEAQVDAPGLSELVVLKGWPHLAKRNRKDDSLATSDLFRPHPTILRAWRYHSRSDGQITLITGKKFDPAPLEDAIASSSALIREVLVFGKGRLVPGALIFLSKSAIRNEEAKVKQEICVFVDDLNRRGESHARISPEMLVFMESDSVVLEKSSKGTIIRRAAEKTFEKEIERAYTATRNTFDLSDECLDTTDTRSIVRSIVVEVIGSDTPLSDSADFYHNGCDSARSTRIRDLLQKKFPVHHMNLPWNIVYDCGSVNRLSDYLLSARYGFRRNETDEAQEMLDLIEQFSHFTLPTNDEPHIKADESSANRDSHVVLLTGATGALGAHILHLLYSDPSITRIICPVRAANESMAYLRVIESLNKRRKPGFDKSSKRVLCVNAQLATLNIGLSRQDYAYLLENVTLVIHAAWAVNFSLPLHSFVDHHVRGLHNLLDLALHSTNRVTFSFCSSTASVLGSSHPFPIPELISLSPSDSSPLGYSRSKWVAESICARASKKSSRICVKIIRIGQLTGDTKSGVWNLSEAWPLMLSTVDMLVCLPRLKEPLSWLPVDTAAKAVIDIATSQIFHHNDWKSEHECDGRCEVYHLVNNSTSSTWEDLLMWLRRYRDSEKEFEIVEPQIWLDKLETLDEHPAKSLLGLWRKAYGKEQSLQKVDSSIKGPIFVTGNAEMVSATSRQIKDSCCIDEWHFRKIWDWLVEEIRYESERVKTRS